jgi:DNA-binding NarL/FixJ family response regulator
MPDLRVRIVADNPLVHMALATVLATQPGYTAVGQMAGDADALARNVRGHPGRFSEQMVLLYF